MRRRYSWSFSDCAGGVSMKAWCRPGGLPPHYQPPHGTIVAQGRPGKGATFTVTLPFTNPNPKLPK